MDLALQRRRALRRDSTNAELLLWNKLRRRRLEGFKFRRQHSVGSYIIDFYCAESQLAVELDGGQHFEPPALAYDERRTAFLRRQGIAVIRFQTDVVFQELTVVLECIAKALSSRR